MTEVHDNAQRFFSHLGVQDLGCGSSFAFLCVSVFAFEGLQSRERVPND